MVLCARFPNRRNKSLWPLWHLDLTAQEVTSEGQQMSAMSDCSLIIQPVSGGSTYFPALAKGKVQHPRTIDVSTCRKSVKIIQERRDFAIFAAW